MLSIILIAGSAVKSPSNAVNVMHISLPSRPVKVSANRTSNKDIPLTKNKWDENFKTLVLGFENFSEGVVVDIHW